MALPYRPAAGDVLGSARASRLEADHIQPDLAAQMLCLDRLVGDRARVGHTGKAGDGFAAVARNA